MPKLIKAQFFIDDFANSEQSFWQRVAETQEWCAMHFSADDPRFSLRSKKLGPPSVDFSWAPSWDGTRSISEWNDLRADEDARRSWVDTMSDGRASLLADAVRHPGSVSDCNRAQQFLVYLPGTNLGDGAAASVSAGYFDNDNIAPWDTWLMYCPAYCGEGKLISLVPPELTEMVDYAMRCNAEECLYWATASQLFSKVTTKE